ncbi:Magnesium transporter NIPA2 [Ceratocystis lukuohia]|uniref:Magnesium transporter NIPA2 n=3 Tax=Ceratocystis TaxID=5157 RepID=A0A0F8BUZ5_CERFI|nr:Magnesium transporter NIPA2 [Ceratocystis platani]PHH55278.1 putative magnesium transporter NIPA5 [Ceratocystis fimbriata CBS 114723]
MELEQKYVGLGLAICSSLAIGASFVVTKKGLMQAEQRHGFEGDGFVYLRNPVWWFGIITMVVGEICNFAAYAFAPAILVTPLGALSVLIGAVLSSYFLKEELGILGKLGSAICLLGAVIIVLHAPADEDIQTIDQILEYAIQPGFLIYTFAVTVFAVVMIYKVAPIHGKKNALIYLSICSTVGSISVMSVKAFGIALRLTLSGNNQFSHPSTYVFMITTTVCILVQMNYFNKALAQFPTNIVNPLYYVTFTTATLVASFILFRGFNTTDAVNTLSLLCGFLITFTGVYLLNISNSNPNGQGPRNGNYDITGTDMVSSIQTRLSMQSRRSSMHRMSIGSQHGDRRSLIRAFDEEEAAGFSFGRGRGDDDDDDDNDDSDDAHGETRPMNSSSARRTPRGLKSEEDIELQEQKGPVR